MSRQHCETVFAQLYRLVTFVTISLVGLAAFCPLFWAQGRSGRARCCWRVLQADRRTLLTRWATPKADATQNKSCNSQWNCDVGFHQAFVCGGFIGHFGSHLLCRRCFTRTG